jgi:hypothetical protein
MRKLLQFLSNPSASSKKIAISIGYLFIVAGIFSGIFFNVRYGAISLGIGLGIKIALEIPENWRKRPIEVVIPLAIAVALITIAILLPRSSA